jgi:hypothetical protein
MYEASIGTFMAARPERRRAPRISGAIMAETGLPKDLFEWMQKMWNPMSFPIPGMLTPTANIDEIQTKIRELKSVENWLTMNVGFVQMTIKTLEMQKAALEALGAGDKPKGP